jgi:hypothetical protein
MGTTLKRGEGAGETVGMRSQGPLALVGLLLLASLAAAAPIVPPVPAPLLWSMSPEAGTHAVVAMDALGGIYVAGQALGGAALWKLDPTGVPVWRAPLETLVVHGVAAMPGGGAVVAGTTLGDGADILVLAFDDQGAPVWRRTVATVGDDIAHGIAADATGVYVTGASGLDALVARFGPDGTLQWVHTRDTGREEVNEGVAILADHSAVAAGWVYDGKRTNLTLYHADTQGDVFPDAWMRTLSAPGGASQRALGISSWAGGVVLAGEVADAHGRAPLVAALNNEGGLRWQTTLSPLPGGVARAVASDIAGGAVVVGEVPGAGGHDWFLARISPFGDLGWVVGLDLGGDDAAGGVAFHPLGFLVAAGQGGGAVTVAASLDAPVRVR